MDIILEAVKKSSEPLETDLNKKKNLTFNYKKPNLKTIASSAVEQAQSNPGQLKILQLLYVYGFQIGIFNPKRDLLVMIIQQVTNVFTHVYPCANLSERSLH